MRLMIIPILLTVLMFSVPGFAEMYQYTDQDGTVRFTDNLPEVPEAQQNTVKAMEEIQSYPEEVPEASEASKEEALPESESAPPPVPDPLPDQTTNKVTESNSLEAKKALDSERAEIQALYEQIEEDKKSMGDPPPATASAIERRVYQQGTIGLNQRIEDYEARVEAYRKKLDAFNAGGPAKSDAVILPE